MRRMGKSFILHYTTADSFTAVGSHMYFTSHNVFHPRPNGIEYSPFGLDFTKKVMYF